MMRKVITENSVWMIDVDSQMFSRFPRRGEDLSSLEHPGLSYKEAGKPEQFLQVFAVPTNAGGWFGVDPERCVRIDPAQLSDFGNYRVMVQRASDGHRLLSGYVEEDSDPFIELIAQSV